MSDTRQTNKPVSPESRPSAALGAPPMTYCRTLGANRKRVNPTKWKAHSMGSPNRQPFVRPHGSLGVTDERQ